MLNSLIGQRTLILFSSFCVAACNQEPPDRRMDGKRQGILMVIASYDGPSSYVSLIPDGEKRSLRIEQNDKIADLVSSDVDRKQEPFCNFILYRFSGDLSFSYKSDSGRNSYTISNFKFIKSVDKMEIEKFRSSGRVSNKDSRICSGSSL
jgi:hypothetical protein